MQGQGLQVKGNTPRIISTSGCFPLDTQQPQLMKAKYFPFLNVPNKQCNPLGRLPAAGKAQGKDPIEEKQPFMLHCSPRANPRSWASSCCLMGT